MKSLRNLTVAVMMLMLPSLVGAAGKRGGGFWTPLSKSAAGPNCYWTCNDGRTGSAEVTNYPDDCAALCETACHGPCVEEAQ